MPRRLLRLAASLCLLTLIAEAAPALAFMKHREAMDVCTLKLSNRAEEAVALAREKLTADQGSALSDHARGEVLTCLGEALELLGQYDEAVTSFLEALALLESVPEGTGGIAFSLHQARNGLASAYEQTGKYRAALELRVALLEQGGNKVLLLGKIGTLHLLLGERREAEATYLSAVASLAEGRRQDQWYLPLTYIQLALLYRLEERFESAEATLRDGMAAAEQARSGSTGSGPGYAFSKLQALTLPLLSQSLGWIFYEQGRYAEARNAAESVLAAYEQEGDADSSLSTDVKVLLARIEDAERPGSPEAERYLLSAVAAPEDDYEIGYTSHAIAQGELARHRLMRGGYAAAEPLAQEAVETLVWGLGETHFQTARAKVFLAQALQGQGKLQEALPVALAAYLAQRQVLPPYHRETGKTLTLLIELYEALGRREDLAATLQLIAQHQTARAKFESGR